MRTPNDKRSQQGIVPGRVMIQPRTHGPLPLPACPRPPRSAAQSAPGIIQRRAYGDLTIREYLADNPQGLAESRHAYVTRVTASFRSTHQYSQRSDLTYLRDHAWGARAHLAAYPAVINVQLAAGFNNHVLGNMAGVGWHSEAVHANNTAGYSYANMNVLAANKGTYYASNVMIAGAAKAGNNGRSTFFPATLSIADIRSDALYVANTYAQAGQIRRGRAPKSGVIIDCLINGGVVESAYPFKPGW